MYSYYSKLLKIIWYNILYFFFYFVVTWHSFNEIRFVFFAYISYWFIINFLAFLIVLNTMRSKTSRYSADEKLDGSVSSDIDSLSWAFMSHFILSHFHASHDSSASPMFAALPLTNANQCFSYLSPSFLPLEDHRMINAGKHSSY